MAFQRSSMGQSERGTPQGGHTTQAKQTPYWMVTVLKKTPLTRTQGELRFAAEAVLLPDVLLLLADSLSAEEAPRSSKQTLEKRNVAPRSKLVQSYHQEAKCQRLRTSGPPWLVKQTQSNTGSKPVTCLYTPAWEQKHRPLEGVNFPLVNCNERQQDQTLNSKIFGRAKLASAQMSEAGVNAKAAYCQGAFNSNGAALSVVLDTCNGASKEQVSDKPLPAGAFCGQKADFGQHQKEAPLVARLGRKVIGAAAAVRRKLSLQKRLKVVNSVPHPSTNASCRALSLHVSSNRIEPRGFRSGSEHETECTVYRQRVRSCTKVETGAGMPGLLIEGATDSTARSRKDASGRQVVLAFSGEAARAFENVHEGGCYLLPAPMHFLPSLPSTNSPPCAPPLFLHASLPVIDLRLRESVHSFSFLSRGPPVASGNGISSRQSLVAQKESIVIEVPDWIHGKLSTTLEHSLSAKRAEETARELLQAEAEMIRLRGRVTSVLRLQLAWGCPYCGSLAPSDFRELPHGASSAVRCGCICCCTDESVRTVLLREACFAFDDGVSQCEVWANGEAAAALLGLPYTDVNTFTVNPPTIHLDIDSLQTKSHCSIAAEANSSQRSADHNQRPVVNGLSSQAPCTLQRKADQTDCSIDRLASAANPSKTLGQVYSGSNSHQHQQPAAADTESLGVKRLHSSLDSVEPARRKLLESVNKRPKLGRRHEPDLLWRNLHRCILDLPKLEALVCKEGLIVVKANPEGAADGSFQASKRDMTGRRTGQLAASDREALEVLLNEACCQGQKVLQCVSLRESANAHTCFQRSEKCSSTGADRCRVYLSGQTYEIYAPNISRYRALKVEPVSFTTEAAALSRLLSESVD